MWHTANTAAAGCNVLQQLDNKYKNDPNITEACSSGKLQSPTSSCLVPRLPPSLDAILMPCLVMHTLGDSGGLHHYFHCTTGIVGKPVAAGRPAQAQNDTCPQTAVVLPLKCML